MEEHNCPLRNKIIEDGDCFETVMAILGMNSKKYKEELLKEYPNCKEVCEKCSYNKER